MDAPSSAKGQRVDGGQAEPSRAELVRRVLELCGDSDGSLGSDEFFKLRESHSLLRGHHGCVPTWAVFLSLARAARRKRTGRLPPG